MCTPAGMIGDVRSGKRSGVESTPTFFINEAIYTGPITFEAMSEEIEKVTDAQPNSKS